jgi:maltose O-acetyltransferase
MKTEKQKMIAGELYDASDSQLVTGRQRARNLLKRLNESREDEQEERARILMELIGAETDVYVQPPFFCDYGTNIALGKKVFMNFNCVILDLHRCGLATLFSLDLLCRSIPLLIPYMHPSGEKD